MKLYFRRSALRDLEGIHRYISQDNPTAAQTVIARIRAASQRLILFPKSGRSGQVEDTRELVVPGLPYIVVYTVEGEEIDIRAVYHGARDRSDD